MRGLLTSGCYTIRFLLRSPGFTVTAVLILGFGIGANAAIFCLINAVVLKPLPYPHPDRLVNISTPRETIMVSVDLPDYVDFRASQQSFDSIAAVNEDFLDLSDSNGPQRLNAGFVSASLFAVTGIGFVLGRPFTDKEDTFGGPLVVVLAEQFWREHFQSDPGVLGKNITLSGRSYEVIGVCPKQVDDWGIHSPNLYVPVHTMAQADDPVLRRDSHFLRCYGRLKPGMSVERARLDLELIRRGLVVRYPETNRGYGVSVLPLLDNIVGHDASNLWLLGASAACILLLAVVNVANLLFCRAIERRNEMMIRRALGATRLALAGQALIESSVLALLGAGAGLLIASFSIGLIRAVSLQEDLPRADNIFLDRTTLIFFVGMTGLVAVLSGWLPASKMSAINVDTVLRDGNVRAGTAGPKRQKTQQILVMGQVALSCVLLIGTALLIRSFVAAQSRSLGFNPDRLLAAELSLTSRKYEDPVSKTQFFDTVLEGVRRLPGVTAVAMNEDLPFDSNWCHNDPFTVLGKPAPEPGHEPRLAPQRISSDYFRTMQVTLLQGRDFGVGDSRTSQPVVIIDQAFATHYFPDADPIGKQIKCSVLWAANQTCTIVGVASNVLHTGPDSWHAAFDAYFPHRQQPTNHEVLVLRASGDLKALDSGIRKIVASVDPEIPVMKIKAVKDLITDRFASRRTGMFLVASFSITALFLSAIGIYGTLAYTVIQRTREMGIRMSLGATSLAIFRLILRDGLRIIGIGIVVGVIVAESVIHLFESVFYGVSSRDPIALGAGVIVLAVVAFAACLFPALRAARVSPGKALRE